MKSERIFSDRIAPPQVRLIVREDMPVQVRSILISSREAISEEIRISGISTSRFRQSLDNVVWWYILPTW